MSIEPGSLTPAVSSRGERMRASGLLDCEVRPGQAAHAY